MFFIGVFSTHITYIILALIYVFGYGTYALNLKKQKGEDHTEYKSITYQKPAYSKPVKTFYVSKITHNSCSEIKVKEHAIKTYNYRFIKHKLKTFDCKSWTSYNYQLPNITRPSPTQA
ncbi:hypothetical protein [Plebeiibacterium sediminum]|uniref:Uncharacterized protein n=1 Tax=Plebeiibacterium sediminum TaxID=2992112 RepID=A0AAE3M194_9BACT|nr:hypothetical protein [Plebeiobacterium sediminum]MCW3785362.1 hypothetical protein [Plebeiobacterium sediminum]